MLTTGLDILRILAETGKPLTATAIAERVGLHVSNVSRTLRVLSAHGYVRKPSYHSFAPDLGVLALAGSAVMQLPLIKHSRDPLIRIAGSSGLQATLATLHRDQVLYLHRAQPSGHCLSGVAGGFPLHLSVVGLRLLMDLPAKEALAALERARARYGWERPSARCPTDPPSCLKALPGLCRDGVLRTDHWLDGSGFAAAVSIHLPDQPPLALSLDGPGERDHQSTLLQAAGLLKTHLLEYLT